MRDGVLKSRHTIFLVTAAMLQQARGWGIVELAWADLLQENLRQEGGVLQNIMLPLFFLPQDDPHLPRSVWHAIRDRCAFHAPDQGDPVRWAVGQITAFLTRENQRALDILDWLQQDSHFRDDVQKRPGLAERITGRHPALVPPPPMT